MCPKFILFIKLLIFLSIPSKSKTDWVEIPQISPNIKINLDDIPTTTTPLSYESVMKTPVDQQLTTELYNRENSTKFPEKSDFFPEISEEENRPIDSTNDENETIESESVNGEENYGDNKDSYPGFLEFLENIQSDLLRNKHNTLKSKINVLRKLRDDLLIEIGDRINNLFKSEAPRGARSYSHEEHDMHFPSNEGALMTMGFLTFAVLLIKLVLKVVHALKYKKNANNGVIMTSSAATTYYGRKKRNLEAYDNAKILQLIEEYSFN